MQCVKCCGLDLNLYVSDPMAHPLSNKSADFLLIGLSFVGLSSPVDDASLPSKGEGRIVP